MSIAFLTLILGFLLGKSTSDRYHVIKDHKRQTELLLRLSQGGNDIDKIEDALITMVRAKLLTNFKEYYSDHHFEVNNLMKNNFTSCMHTSLNFNTSQEDFEDFTRHLIREEQKSFIKCADNLNHFVQNLQET
jgi:2-methylisocitrate lyase-like PEP mutase family enzyme